MEEIIANVENGIKNLPIRAAENIRMETARILQRAALPKNLTRKESRALRELRQDDSIVILAADKGNATVVMESTD
ncbi:hypothetical protein NQ315_006665 [Exocentrus adspersus]|uniref:Uncharacterized protein n=1 Tax=Exocentrus adspersus TaxID=1586481 RepID=A0AAV8WBD6_9CUCU|nr:hypothetical protein NQ315_006665 [Exocentrus adspersus]